MRSKDLLTVGCLVVAFGIGGCGGRTSPTPPPTPGASEPPAEAAQPSAQEVEAVTTALKRNAERARIKKANMSFEDFKKTVYREPFEGGKYIVNGDTPIRDEKQLLDFYERNVKSPSSVRLVLNQVAGMDNAWGADEKQRITYCVSRTFGPRYDTVVREMANAVSEWEKSAAVDFVHQAAEDARCGPSNASVVFDVRPVNDGGYLARAFFPKEPRAASNVLVDESALTLPAGKLQLVGILRHELGHTLGFRHEHTRPEAGDCFEDNDWQSVGNYDAFSVMHYPQCNGKGDWSLNLTSKDRHGAACVYGAAAGFTLNPNEVDISKCAKDTPGGQAITRTYQEVLQKNGEKGDGPFPVRGGSEFTAKMSGSGASGDPDLYVNFGSPPSVANRRWRCRPYLTGATESCRLTVPPADTEAWVLVYGYTASQYRLEVSYVQPGAP